MKKCEECMLHHPERDVEHECSCFGKRENKTGDCSAYIQRNPPGSISVEEYIRQKLNRGAVAG